ncbi:MAG: hypothetical protein ACXVY8_08485 [Gaiellaceae bacterium]
MSTGTTPGPGGPALDRPSRWIALALVLLAALCGVGLLLEQFLLPGWAVVGGVLALVLLQAVRSSLGRGWLAVRTWWSRAGRHHSPLRPLAYGLALEALARLALPLALFPLVIVLFASRGLPLAAEAGVGAAVALLGALIVTAERPSIAVLLTWVRREHRTLLGVVAATLAIYVLVPAIVVTVAKTSSRLVIASWLVEHGGFTTLLAIGAAVLWLLSGAVRTIAFASSPIRLLGLVPMVAAGARGLIAVGLVPGDDLAARIDGRVGGPLWFWLGLFVAGLAVALTGRRIHVREQRRWTRWRRASRTLELLGLAGAAAATLVLLVAIAAALQQSIGAGRSVDAGSRPSERPGLARWLELPGDRALAYAFAPVLELNANERWPLAAIDSTFLADVTIKGPGRQGSVLPQGLPTSCPGRRGPSCYVLSCPDCVQGTPVGRGGGTAGVEYARVLRRSRASDAAAFIPPDPLRTGQRLEAIVEYWLFYPFDRWEATTAVGKLVQEHEGDWETVVVGFSAKQPLFVAYSAHCGGSWNRWPAVEARTADLLPNDGRVPSSALHPLVAVALGSHANYPNAAGRRASDWGSCKHIAREATGVLSYTWNVRDRTSADYELKPAEVVLVGRRSGPTGFAGAWGGRGTDTTALKYVTGGGEHRLASGNGPISPALKDLWTMPSWVIFRTKEWREG